MNANVASTDSGFNTVVLKRDHGSLKLFKNAED